MSSQAYQDELGLAANSDDSSDLGDISEAPGAVLVDSD